MFKVLEYSDKLNVEEIMVNLVDFIELKYIPLELNGEESVLDILLEYMRRSCIPDMLLGEMISENKKLKEFIEKDCLERRILRTREEFELLVGDI